MAASTDKYYAELDRELLRQFAEDPQSAFRKMFDAYHMQLCVYAVQLMDSFELAEEAVQDVFIYFWEREYYKRITENLRGYLLTSTRNMALAHLRRYRQYSMEDMPEVAAEIPDESEDEEEWEEKVRRLYADLEKLPEQEVAAVKAVIVDEKTYKEAAEELRMSVNTLKTHLARALRKLRARHNLLFFYLG